MPPYFREHFVLNLDVFLLFEFVSLSVFVISEFNVMFLTLTYSVINILGLFLSVRCLKISALLCSHYDLEYLY